MSIIQAWFATSSREKAEEANAIIRDLVAESSDGLFLELRARGVPDLWEAQHLEVEEVARLKAQAAYAIVQEPVVVEDTGLYFHAWGKLPGSLIKWFLAEVGNEGLLRMLSPFEDRRAYAVTSFVYADALGTMSGVGRLDGAIADRPFGDAGFGWDCIFVPATTTPSESSPIATLATLEPAAKNKISMRRAALKDLLDRLKQRS